MEHLRCLGFISSELGRVMCSEKRISHIAAVWENGGQEFQAIYVRAWLVDVVCHRYERLNC